MSNPRNATSTKWGGRSYVWREERFDSVTTIISGGVPKGALKAWGERLVAETAVNKRDIWDAMDANEAIDWLKRAPYRETEKAAAQGSDIHDWAERHALGLAPTVDDVPAVQRGYVEGFGAFVADWSPTWHMSEATVYSRAHGYAGTLDALISIEGLGLGLVDYKTGKGVYGEVALQLAAYRHAEFVGLATGTEAPLPAVDWCGVLHLTPKGYELIPVTAGPDEFRAFLYAQQVREFVENASKSVLGAPLIAPQRVVA